MVLICDDDRLVTNTFTDILNKEGYRTCSVDCGEQALEFIKTVQTRVVILDYTMPPGENGGIVLRKIKRIDPIVKVIMLSAYMTVQNSVDLMKAGAWTVMQKPPSIRTLITEIEKALASDISILQAPITDQEIINNVCRGLIH